MDDMLKRIAHQYIEDVNCMIRKMLKAMDVKNKEELLNLCSKNRKGIFKSTDIYEYVFHGRGCRVTYGKFVLDWDFGYNKEWCGINIFLLYYYIQQKYSDLAKIYNTVTLKSEFERAVLKKEMIYKYDLYYFS